MAKMIRLGGKEMITKTASLSSGILSVSGRKDDRPIRLPADGTDDIKDYQIYNFKDSGDGKSWLLGTDNSTDESWNFANAYINGIDACPVDIIVPRSLTNEEGMTKPVEVIGQMAYYNCADADLGSITKSVLVTKQVRIIKYLGFGRMYYLESFQIEEWSVLESIETKGLGWVGYDYVKNPKSRRKTLILPSTLSYAAQNAIYYSNLFGVIIYCGSHPLTENSNLEDGTYYETEVMVTNQYPGGSIFGRPALKGSQTEVNEQCKSYTYDFKYVQSDQGAIITGWGNETHNWCPYTLVIPEEINGSTVVAVNESAFANCDTLSPISLPSTLKQVGAFAFANTSSATAVFSNSSELEVGESAFQGCGKGTQQPINASLPQNTRLDKRAFAEAKIGEVYVM